MMDYKNLKFNELKSAFSNFSFSKEAQSSIKSELWRNKYGLWTLLSAAFDEAAKECYKHVNTFVDDLVDIDTCTIHSLKSIAKSADLDFLCKGIREDYPFDILELMNLLSVPKNILLDENRILSEEANDKLNGSIALRAINDPNFDSSLSMNTLYEIKNNIGHIKTILNSNLVFTNRKIVDLLDESTLQLLETASENGIDIDITCDDLLNKIDSIRFEVLKNFQNDIIVELNDKTILNYFAILINIIKSNFYNEEYDFYLIPRYFNEDQNIEIDLTPLFINILNPIVSDDTTYVNKFICFHFYNLIASKIRNESLKKMFTCIFDNKEKHHKVILNDVENEYEYEKDEFLDSLYRFLDEDETEEFLNQKYPAHNENIQSETNSIKIEKSFTKALLNFVEYMKFIMSFKFDNIANLKFDVLKINFFDSWPIYSGKDTYSLFGKDGIIINIAKELTDIVLHIIDIRNQIKTSIQQYSLIRNKENCYRHSC